MKRVLVACVMAGSTAFLACGDGQIGDRNATSEPAASRDLIISEHSSARTRGQLATSAGQVEFSASETSADRSEFSLRINGKLLEAILAGGATLIDGHGVQLDAVDRDVLRTLAERLDHRLSTEVLFRRDEALHGFISYLAIAPEGYVHESLDVASAADDLSALEQALAAAGGDEGIKCIKKNVMVSAAYTDQGGEGYSEPIMVGSNRPNNYGCMGRCGAGCSGFGGGYTKDCLDHDACSYRFKSKNGSRDVNCGDEYKAASDDFFRSSACKG